MYWDEDKRHNPYKELGYDKPVKLTGHSKYVNNVYWWKDIVSLTMVFGGQIIGALGIWALAEQKVVLGIFLLYLFGRSVIDVLYYPHFEPFHQGLLSGTGHKLVELRAWTHTVYYSITFVCSFIYVWQNNHNLKNYDDQLKIEKDLDSMQLVRDKENYLQLASLCVSSMTPALGSLMNCACFRESHIQKQKQSWRSNVIAVFPLIVMCFLCIPWMYFVSNMHIEINKITDQIKLPTENRLPIVLIALIEPLMSSFIPILYSDVYLYKILFKKSKAQNHLDSDLQLDNMTFCTNCCNFLPFVFVWNFLLNITYLIIFIIGISKLFKIEGALSKVKKDLVLYLLFIWLIYNIVHLSFSICVLLIRRKIASLSRNEQRRSNIDGIH